ncbi:hypothetical protein [Rubritalea tangerina]|uniref:hypothetical protein n=1 Tax=Rubritalea tangerina TaxID=430798 RepID=UPI003613996C
MKVGLSSWSSVGCGVLLGNLLYITIVQEANDQLLLEYYDIPVGFEYRENHYASLSLVKS